VPVTATVQASVDDAHVLVVTSSGQRAVMLASHLYPSVPAERLIVPGQELKGRLDSTGAVASFIPDIAPDDAVGRVSDTYPVGSTALAYVSEVGATSGKVLLHPSLSAEVVAEGPASLAHLVSVGDIVAMEIRTYDPDPRVVLGNDDDTVPGIAVIPGGPPWLVAEVAEVEVAQPVDGPKVLPSADDEETADPAEAADSVASPESISFRLEQSAEDPASVIPTLRRQLQQANDAAEQFAEMGAELERTVSAKNREIRVLKAELRKTRKDAASWDYVPEVFTDGEQQLRFEVMLSYHLRVDDNTRQDYPLPDEYIVGPEFLTSIEELQGISRRKIVDVLAETLCGLAHDLPARETHPWLTGKSATQQTRGDGAKAWRVSLQSHAPGARRLKYWRHLDGTLELDSVGHHDKGLN
jgi:hypothetical protein